jgi:hypothetical protein
MTGNNPGADRPAGIVGGAVAGVVEAGSVGTVVPPLIGCSEISTVVIMSLTTVIGVETGLYPSAATVMICAMSTVTSSKTTVPVPGPELPPTFT